MCPQALSPIPLAVPIVEKDGAITAFFRLRWQELIGGFTVVPTKANTQVASGRTSALATTTIFTTTAAGMYRVVVYLEKTVAGGVSSSLTPTIGWTRGGLPLSKTFAAFTTDAAGANESFVHEFQADANTAITLAVAYASNAAATMTWSGWSTAELMA